MKQDQEHTKLSPDLLRNIEFFVEDGKIGDLRPDVILSLVHAARERNALLDALDKRCLSWIVETLRYE